MKPSIHRAIILALSISILTALGESDRMKRRCAVVVGHNEKAGGYYCPTLRESEFRFNTAVAAEMDLMSHRFPGLELGFFKRQPSSSYTREIQQVYRDVDAWDADVSMELHFNAASVGATGTMVLHSGSEHSKWAAESVQDVMLRRIGLRDRGLLERTENQRGGKSLHTGKAPAILVEPFFCSNPGDAKRAQEIGKVGFADMYLNGFCRIFKMPEQDPVAEPEPVNENWIIDVSKDEFLTRNRFRISRLIRQVNDWADQRFGSDARDLYPADFYSIFYAEAATRNGRINPRARHSLGEYGVLPLPSNLAFWTGLEGFPNKTVEQNIYAFCHYLVALKNHIYDDYFDDLDAARHPAMLAAVVHGHFYSPNYKLELPTSAIADMIRTGSGVGDHHDLISGMGYKNAFALTGRADNLEKGLMIARTI